MAQPRELESARERDQPMCDASAPAQASLSCSPRHDVLCATYGASVRGGGPSSADPCTVFRPSRRHALTARCPAPWARGGGSRGGPSRWGRWQAFPGDRLITDPGVVGVLSRGDATLAVPATVSVDVGGDGWLYWHDRLPLPPPPRPFSCSPIARPRGRGDAPALG